MSPSSLHRSPISWVGTLMAALFAMQAPAWAFVVPRQASLPPAALRRIIGPQHHTSAVQGCLRASRGCTVHMSAEPLWDIKQPQSFTSIRDASKSGGVSLNMKEGKKDFFRDFKLTEPADGAKASPDEFTTALRGIVWFISTLWPHIAFGVLCSGIAQVLMDQNLLTPMYSNDVPDLQKIHGFVGTILGFTIGFRTNAAYDRFYEGRKILTTVMDSSRAIIRDAYSFLLKPGAGGSEEEVRRIADDMSRRLDVLFAFVRQSVRESALGFGPNSGMADVPFTDNSYYLDTSEPQLVDLLTPAEAERYSHFSPRARPGTVASELTIIVQLLGSRFQFTDGFLGRAQANINAILDAHSTMIRIRDTPLPYPYVLILSVATFLFVYATPFLYNAGAEGRYFGVQFLVFSYYGILQIGSAIENPFAWDETDIDMEAFARNLHNDTHMIAKAHNEDRKDFLQEYIGNNE